MSAGTLLGMLPDNTTVSPACAFSSFSKRRSVSLSDISGPAALISVSFSARGFTFIRVIPVSSLTKSVIEKSEAALSSALPVNPAIKPVATDGIPSSFKMNETFMPLPPKKGLRAKSG